MGVVVQTTQTRANLASVAAALAPVARELLVFNTICDATEKRQSAACELAAEVDVVIVVGSPNSSNSNRLREVAANQGVAAYMVDNATQINPAWLEGKLRQP